MAIVEICKILQASQRQLEHFCSFCDNTCAARLRWHPIYAIFLGEYCSGALSQPPFMACAPVPFTLSVIGSWGQWYSNLSKYEKLDEET